MWTNDMMLYWYAVRVEFVLGVAVWDEIMRYSSNCGMWQKTAARRMHTVYVGAAQRDLALLTGSDWIQHWWKGYFSADTWWSLLIEPPVPTVKSWYKYSVACKEGFQRIAQLFSCIHLFLHVTDRRQHALLTVCSRNTPDYMQNLFG